jgi:pseudouridine-5'-phosphate glycosidase
VAVLGYRTDAFPGFYIADSGYPAPFRVESPAEVTAIAHARDALGIDAAVLVARPVPAEHQLDAGLHARVLADALAAADAQNVHGHDVTPFLLEFFHTATHGASEATNVEIYLGNVALGGEIAAAW